MLFRCCRQLFCKNRGGAVPLSQGEEPEGRSGHKEELCVRCVSSYARLASAQTPTHTEVVDPELVFSVSSSGQTAQMHL